jgi:glycosyltransferase involved in cell wall biosynthesis
MTRPERVLMTADAVGGVWTYAVELAGRLAARGVRVTLAVMGPAPSALQRASAAKVADVQIGPFALEWMQDPWADVARAGEWLLELEQRTAPDVVHVNGFAHAALPFRAPVLMAAHSCVVTWWAACRGGEPPPSFDRYREAVQDGLRHASAVVAPSRAMLDAFLGAHDRSGVHRGRARVIYNAVDPSRFAGKKKSPLVLGAGRVWDEAKNLAALDTVAGGLSWPVVLAGPETTPDGVTSRRRHAIRLGALSPPDVARWMSRAAVFALPARYEPFGLSPLEAALSGCALVLGDVPSLREIWGDAAVYVSPDDHDALRGTLEALASDARLREDRAARAHERAQLYASPSRLASEYLDLYGSLAGDRGQRELVCA